VSQAARDLDDAGYLREGGRHNTACFMAHQAAVKALTGYLYAEGAEAVWGNSVADLCEDAKAIDPSFDVIKTVAMLLDKHYLATRYPSALPGGVPAEAYDADDSARALEIAGDVDRFVRERLASLAGP